MCAAPPHPPAALPPQAMSRAMDAMRIGGIQASGHDCFGWLALARVHGGCQGSWSSAQLLLCLLDFSRPAGGACPRPATLKHQAAHSAHAPPVRSCTQKHCALNLMRGLQIAAPSQGEVEVVHLTPSWVVSAQLAL